jgi:hypothetical protein
MQCITSTVNISHSFATATAIGASKKLPNMILFSLRRRASPGYVVALCQWPYTNWNRSFAAARKAINASDEELQAARRWLDKLHADTIPKSIGELSFSRSSGPGGQNVNKYVSD